VLCLKACGQQQRVLQANGRRKTPQPLLVIIQKSAPLSTTAMLFSKTRPPESAGKLISSKTGDAVV
jgi:hypothetical protein